MVNFLTMIPPKVTINTDTGTELEQPIYLMRKWKDERTPLSRVYYKITHTYEDGDYAFVSAGLCDITTGMKHKDYFTTDAYEQFIPITKEEFEEHAKEYFDKML